MKVREGSQNGKGLRFGLVVSKFNEMITNRLYAAAIQTLQDAGVQEAHLETVKVPGAFEIPLLARRLAQSGRVDAVICLGAVIRGETPHFDYICAEVSRGIAETSWESGIPVIFGVLTTETVDQALARAGSLERNRGAESARTALEMVTLLRQVTTRKNPSSLKKRPKTSTNRKKVQRRS